MRPAIFLDRDGVIIKAMIVDGLPHPIDSVSEVELVHGFLEFWREFNKKYVFVVITNQPDVARGKQLMERVEEIHQAIVSLVPLKYFYVCFHDDQDECNCRKPMPGLILKAASDLGLSLDKSFLVGDRWRDIGAGQCAGVKSFFLDYQYSEAQPSGLFTKVFSFGEISDILRTL